MLHIPREKRLKDPVNLAQMLEIERRYPNVKVIIAHVGRAYCPEDVGNAFEVLAETENMMFDFSANTNAEIFQQLIKAVGTKRIMFGSDLPITRMRLRRIYENGTYINLVPEGLCRQRPPRVVGMVFDRRRHGPRLPARRPGVRGDRGGVEEEERGGRTGDDRLAGLFVPVLFVKPGQGHQDWINFVANQLQGIA